MDFSPGQQKLLAYFGTIQQAVAQRVSTADLWTAVRAASTAEGVTLSGVGIQDMNTLRGIAAGQRNAMERFGAAGAGDAITGQMIAQDLSARPLQDQLLAPKWIVRFEHDVSISGQLETLWRSSVFDGSLPTTTSALRGALEGDGEALATDYGETHLGIGRISITAA